MFPGYLSMQSDYEASGIQNALQKQAQLPQILLLRAVHPKKRQLKTIDVSF